MTEKRSEGYTRLYSKEDNVPDQKEFEDFFEPLSSKGGEKSGEEKKKEEKGAGPDDGDRLG